MGALTTHLVERYGPEEVRGWGFEIWNEANLDGFWAGTLDEYFRLYEISAAAVKRVDQAIPVGGPASAAVAWIDEMFIAAAQSGAPLDFLSTHTYGNAPLDLRPIAARHGRPDVPLWWTEWGAHATHFNRAHDSVWSGAYLARGMVSAMGRLDALAYWTVSDHFEELGRPPALLHGGFGLLSVGNLRKPRWWALWMLEQLRADRLAVRVTGDGAGDMVNAVATRDDDGTVAIVVWNGTVDVTKSGGDELLDRRVELTLANLAARRLPRQASTTRRAALQPQRDVGADRRRAGVAGRRRVGDAPRRRPARGSRAASRRPRRRRNGAAVLRPADARGVARRAGTDLASTIDVVRRRSESPAAGASSIAWRSGTTSPGRWRWPRTSASPTIWRMGRAPPTISPWRPRRMLTRCGGSSACS